MAWVEPPVPPEVAEVVPVPLEGSVEVAPLVDGLAEAVPLPPLEDVEGDVDWPLPVDESVLEDCVVLTSVWVPPSLAVWVVLPPPVDEVPEDRVLLPLDPVELSVDWVVLPEDPPDVGAA